MVTKVFVLGLPGSGKSTATHSIESLAHRHHLKTLLINDYDILYIMYKEDQASQQKRFSSTRYGGFDVHDLTVFDEALRAVERQAQAHLNDVDIIVIEFSRRDYCHALSLFSASFLQDAFFLVIEADMSTCQARVQARVRKHTTRRTKTDDHYVSKYIFETYYNKCSYYILGLNKLQDQDGHYYRIQKKQVCTVDNTGVVPKYAFSHRVSHVAWNLFNWQQLTTRLHAKHARALTQKSLTMLMRHYKNNAQLDPKFALATTS